MKITELKSKFPNLYEAIELLCRANQGQINTSYVFPKEAEDAFADCDAVLFKLTPGELETVVDGEREEGEAILARFGSDGKTLDGFLAECFDGDYADCSESIFAS